MEEGQQWIRLTGIYGVPEAAKRSRTWDLLLRLHDESSLPWFIGGNFNEILNEGEKVGGCSRTPRQMANFNTVLSTCGLDDLGYEGHQFTWSNGREHTHTHGEM